MGFLRLVLNCLKNCEDVENVVEDVVEVLTEFDYDVSAITPVYNEPIPEINVDRQNIQPIQNEETEPTGLPLNTARLNFLYRK